MFESRPRRVRSRSRSPVPEEPASVAAKVAGLSDEGVHGEPGAYGGFGGGAPYSQFDDGGFGGGGGEVRPGDWTCPSCQANVFASKDACFKCGEPKPRGGGGPLRFRSALESLSEVRIPHWADTYGSDPLRASGGTRTQQSGLGLESTTQGNPIRTKKIPPSRLSQGGWAQPLGSLSL